MKSFAYIDSIPPSLPLAAEDITEFHSARILLLLQHCGTGSRIEGLTKFAKLDFFVRYPDFFAAATGSSENTLRTKAVESAMIRYHYGPWDKRYYSILSNLEARGLITTQLKGKAVNIRLTKEGLQRAKSLSEMSSYEPLTERMKSVKKAFGLKSGNYSTARLLGSQLWEGLWSRLGPASGNIIPSHR